LATIHGFIAGKPPLVDFDLERRVQTATREGIRQGWVNSAHDCSEGGIAVALAESCLANQLGCEINLGVTGVERRWDEVLFGESASRILVSVSHQQQAHWEAYLNQQLGGTEGNGTYWQKLGVVNPENSALRLVTSDNQPIIDVTMADMSDAWQNAIPRRLAV